MNEDVSKKLDPRQVLRLLNEFGVKNITAHELKAFMIDLKKIMRHDLIKSEPTPAPVKKPSQMLYSTSTISSRSKHAKPAIENKNICKKVTIEPANSGNDVRKMKTSKNFIKAPIVEKNKKKCDPVALYQYYTNMWQKYKPHLPGENDWADLRWSIRAKLLGERETHSNKENRPLSEEDLARRREGWIE